MSPKSVTEIASIDKSVKTINRKEIKRDEIFTRFDKPFGLEQETFNLIWLSIAHIFAVYITYLNLAGKAPWSVFIVEFFYGYASGFGITVGAHRYWTHKTFKANVPLQWILMILQTISNSYPIHKWCLEHRIHHKYTDTDADPHNAKRGFWFSHMGWQFLPKRKELEHQLKTFDMPDLEKDPIVRFQSKWYWTLTAIFNFLIPISLMYYIWRIPLLYCVASNYRRYVTSRHFTWSVNSFAHIWGDKPYDKTLSSTDNVLVSTVALGEGWHNYHHVFPWDYKTSEFGWNFNLSTIFIDFFASIGWASEMKTVSPKVLKQRLQRTGEGALDVNTDDKICVAVSNKKCSDHTTYGDLMKLVKQTDEPTWGWDDETLAEELRKVTTVLKPDGLTT